MAARDRRRAVETARAFEMQEGIRSDRTDADEPRISNRQSLTPRRVEAEIVFIGNLLRRDERVLIHVDNTPKPLPDEARTVPFELPRRRVVPNLADKLI